MCFSPEVDLTAGVLVTALGVDTIRHASRRDQLALATLPLLFGLHQLIETVVWWRLDNAAPHTLGLTATWTYLFIALILVPIAVPYAFWRADLVRSRMLGSAFLAMGTFAAALDAWVLRLRDVPIHEQGHALSYAVGPIYGPVALGFYIVACCGPAIFGRSRTLAVFGAVNLIAVSALIYMSQAGLISLWCVWAAVTSVLINKFIRTQDLGTYFASDRSTASAQRA